MILGDKLTFTKKSDVHYLSDNPVNNELTVKGYSLFNLFVQPRINRWELYYLCYYIGVYDTSEEAITEAKKWDVEPSVLG